jgi:acetyl-CoA C-acetyltransferase
MREVVIVSAVRTPIGSLGGVFASLSAVELGRIVIEGILERSGVGKDAIDEVIMGQVLQAGCGQNGARQVAVNAGLPLAVPAYTVNKVCGSGLKSVSLGAAAIAMGEAEIVIAGGMESMSRAPHLLEKARSGYPLGDGTLADSILKDALTDAFYGIHMGITAENIASEYGVSREEADAFSVQSQQKAAMAIGQGRFRDEIVPVMVPQRKGEAVAVVDDEHPKPACSVESLARLKPAFKDGGVVTAGNSSGINDGAAAVMLMSGEEAKRRGIKPLAIIRSFASVGLDPRIMGLGPVGAVRKALVKAGMTLDEIDLFELNEAFAVQSLAVVKELGLGMNKVNVNGGAIALGHPVGASGTRILVTLLHEMVKRDARTGLAGLCIGGGQGIAMVVSR